MAPAPIYTYTEITTNKLLMGRGSLRIGIKQMNMYENIIIYTLHFTLKNIRKKTNLNLTMTYLANDDSGPQRLHKNMFMDMYTGLCL